MLAKKECQQTGVNNNCLLRASNSRHDNTLMNIAGSERTATNRQNSHTHTHTHTLAGSERASANRCKKLQSITRLAQKKCQQQIQMNHKYTHTHELQRMICQTYRLADECHAATKDEHVAKSCKRRDAIFTKLQGFR